MLISSAVLSCQRQTPHAQRLLSLSSLSLLLRSILRGSVKRLWRWTTSALKKVILCVWSVCWPCVPCLPSSLQEYHTRYSSMSSSQARAYRYLTAVRQQRKYRAWCGDPSWQASCWSVCRWRCPCPDVSPVSLLLLFYGIQQICRRPLW